MFILTKRSKFNEDGWVSHVIYGWTDHVGEARGWFRSTRTTDVIEIPIVRPISSSGPDGNGYDSFISDTRLGSWREQQYANEKLLAAQKK